MKVVQTTLFPPPVRDTSLSESLRKYFFSVQMLLPLATVDSSDGGGTITLPAPGVNPGALTGQSNQNQELIYIKVSADANPVIIHGAISGDVTLAAQWAFARFKSNATDWFRVG